MKEIVINNKFGGFGLSHRGVMRYAEIKGIVLYPHVDDIVRRVYGADVSLDDAIFVHYTLVPHEEYEKALEQDKQKPLRVGRFEKSNALYFSERDIPRDDPALIQVVRELKGKASKKTTASLKIIKIPCDAEWQIEEYDGLEHIAEKHRTWGE